MMLFMGIVMWQVIDAPVTELAQLEQQHLVLQEELLQYQTQLQRNLAWQTLSDDRLMRYNGLQRSGQWGDQSRLSWLEKLEQLPRDSVTPTSFSFSERQALSPSRVAGWGNIPFKIETETFQAEVIAKHEWHGLLWLQIMDRLVFPTALLQSCDWKLKTDGDITHGLIHIKCRWLILEIKE